MNFFIQLDVTKNTGRLNNCTKAIVTSSKLNEFYTELVCGG